MQLNIYQLEQIASGVGVGVLLCGTITSRRKCGHPSTLLQIIGAALMLTALVINWFPIEMRFDAHNRGTWIWRLEGILSAAGIFVFSCGYWWYWKTRGPDGK